MKTSRLSPFKRLSTDRRAVTAIEYAMIASLIGAAIVAGVMNTGSGVSNSLTSASNSFPGSGGTSATTTSNNGGNNNTSSLLPPGVPGDAIAIRSTDGSHYDYYSPSTGDTYNNQGAIICTTNVCNLT